MTERGQVKARQYTTVQRLIAAQVTAFLIVGPDLIGYYQNNQKIAGKREFEPVPSPSLIRSSRLTIIFLIVYSGWSSI